MDNATKALEIAAGVLLGVLIMSLIAYFFTEISEWPEQEDSMETAEQLAKFNLEYEVYDKKAMYGADVISCLTKAQSNNEKYVVGNQYISGTRYGEDYWVNVFVKINSNLEENIEVYYITKNAITGVNTQQRYFANQGPTDVKMKDIGFKFDDDSYTTFNENTTLKVPSSPPQLTGDPKFINLSENAKTHKSVQYNASLYPPLEVDANGKKKYISTQKLAEMKTPLIQLIDLANTSENMRQTVYNTNNATLEKWSYAIWQTGLYDFKTRRYRCDDIVYNDATGRVSEIYFSEI